MLYIDIEKPRPHGATSLLCVLLKHSDHHRLLAQFMLLTDCAVGRFSCVKGLTTDK